MSKYPALLLAVGASVCISACGMKGSLLLPPGPPPEPWLGNPKPAAKPTTPAPAEPAAKDVSTDRNPTPQ